VTTDLHRRLQASLGGEYLVERELGGGAMSRVFLAEERRLGRRVVVKVLSPEIGTGVSADRFEREIQLAARLQDPRIVPVLQAGQVDDLPYYTMPYIEGPTLRERLAGPALDLESAVGILRDVALGLEYAHARQVVHRDIKPENVLITGRTAVVADFGIAKAITAATQSLSGSTMTSAGTVIGTPAYMAPEQASGGIVDSRADLYAWGMVAYEMLAGAHPFAEHTTVRALLTAQIVEDPAPLATRRPDLPRTLTSLIDQCLRKEPSERPPDAAALVTRLSAAPPAPRRLQLSRLQLAAAVASVVVLAGSGYGILHHQQRIRWARHDALPAAERLAESDLTLAAVELLREAQRILPADTGISHALDADTRLVSVTSSPPGAQVAIRDYNAPDSAWVPLGATPLTDIRIPNGYFRWKVAKTGFGEFVSAPITADTLNFPLGRAVHAPSGMVPVEARVWGDYVDFVGYLGPYALPAFFIDRYEVTNRDYQTFVDAGGYTNSRYWTEPFVRNGRPVSRDQAMALFRDRSGRPGPATWEGGHYPEGHGDYPVAGVSWYEAMAYAAFAGRSLPTFAQWFDAAPNQLGRYVVRESNISRSGPAPVGAYPGLGPYGTYDMAGNVKEWALNAVDADDRIILGGASNSQTYLYSGPESLSAFDRSPENGFRCVVNVKPVPSAAASVIHPTRRDFTAAHPASDAVFDAYRVMYAYTHTGLDPSAPQVVDETADWRKEKVTFNAAYNNERITAFLFLPKRVRPPYQTVLFFPSARVLDLTDSRTLGDTSFFDFVVRSGRAVLYPVYADTYERRLVHSIPGSTEQTVIVHMAQDVGRALDYLASRPDIDSSRIAYMGVSMGAAEGVIFATLEQARLRTAIFLDGGYFLNKQSAGTDQVDFAPRLTRPVLMVNGRYDFSFSLNASQLPLFRMLGTPAAEKEHDVLETPHDVRADRPALIHDVTMWLDRYLGPIR
jgi:eukaryotic-like serine/threonine-protein kinase